MLAYSFQTRVDIKLNLIFRREGPSAAFSTHAVNGVSK